MAFSSTGSCATDCAMEPSAGRGPRTPDFLFTRQALCRTELSQHVLLQEKKRTWGSNPAFELGRLACRRQHLCALVGMAGLQPATSAVSERRSTQLSYIPVEKPGLEPGTVCLQSNCSTNWSYIPYEVVLLL